MEQITRWRPDTCKCVILLKWDDAETEQDRQHNLKEIESKCEAHTAVADKDLLAEVFGENQHKNETVAKVKEVLGLSDQDAIKGDIDFEFDQNRKLTVKVKDFDGRKKASILSAITNDAQNERLNGGKNASRLKDIISK